MGPMCVRNITGEKVNSFKNKLDKFELRKLILGYIHLTSVHEVENSNHMLERNVLQEDDRMLSWVRLEQILEVWRACTEQHLMGLCVLSFTHDGDITERCVVTEVLEVLHHGGLEIVPSQTELL